MKGQRGALGGGRDGEGETTVETEERPGSEPEAWAPSTDRRGDQRPLERIGLPAGSRQVQWPEVQGGRVSAERRSLKPQAAVSKSHQSWLHRGASTQSSRGHTAAEDAAAKIRNPCGRAEGRTLALPGVSVPTEIITGEKNTTAITRSDLETA